MRHVAKWKENLLSTTVNSQQNSGYDEDGDDEMTMVMRMTMMMVVMIMMMMMMMPTMTTTTMTYIAWSINDQLLSFRHK